MIHNGLDLNCCLTGDVRVVLPTLPAGIVQCAVTSPPFWGLRDYGHVDQIGMEPLHDCLGWATGEPCGACGACYVCTMVGVCREIRRVLRDDGTFWLELGDSYNGSGGAGGDYGEGGIRAGQPRYKGRNLRPKRDTGRAIQALKPKDLCGIPWRVALALQADGWFLRSDIVWARPNPMPESVQDRPTKAHSYVFLLTKRAAYYYDPEAIRETFADERMGNPGAYVNGYSDGAGRNDGATKGTAWTKGSDRGGRNTRSVWTIATRPYSGAHFACWPPELVKRCILAGTSEAGCCAACGAPRERKLEREKHPSRDMEAQRLADAERTGRADGHISGPGGMVDKVRTIGWRPTCACDAPSVPCVVLDPFLGSGTTAMVAQNLGRRWLGIELNPAYVDLQTERAGQQALALLTPCGDKL